jgi:sterol carrier protein 2
MTGIPITNVNNNCSTGSTALYQANTWVKSGAAECALALGFERMSPGSLSTHFPDRPSALMPFHKATTEIEDAMAKNYGPTAPRMFANGAQEYFNKYGATVDHLAEIGAKIVYLSLIRTDPGHIRSGKESQTLYK